MRWKMSRFSDMFRHMGPEDVTERDAVLDAIDEFDSLGRTAFLAQYGFGPAQNYIVEYTGRQYDGDALIAVAHGHQHGRPLTSRDLPADGGTAMSALRTLDFRVLLVGKGNATSHTVHGLQASRNVWSVKRGDITTRSAISAAYGGSIYGGIEPSARTPNVLIYVDPARGVLNGYNYDGWDPYEDGVFYYTGEGRKGDQQMVVGNKAVLDHAESGRTLRLFEAADGGRRKGGKRQRYIGAFRVDPAQPWRFEEAPDAHGRRRKVIVFRLLSEECY